MPVVSNQQIITQQNLIKRLMHEEFKTDTEILKQLRISQSALYDYKLKIQQEDQRIWDLVHQDSSKYRAVQLLADLDRCRQECLKISTDKINVSARDRMEALKTSCEASANIFKLLNEGLSFNVSIPLKHSDKEPIPEDKPKEDKDIIQEETERPTNINDDDDSDPQVVPEHNNTVKTDTELIPSGGESWGISKQRKNSKVTKRQY